jgi:hypothetical protein
MTSTINIETRHLFPVLDRKLIDLLNGLTAAEWDRQTAWKLFSKSWKPEQVKDKVSLLGDITLAERVLSMVAVMA